MKKSELSAQDPKENPSVEHGSDGMKDKRPLPFPIIAIGASAGGLEALQDFFDNIIPIPEAAFIVIQHLSPDYKSFMDELLKRHTSLPVEVANDKTPVAINHIYLIQPGMNMTIEGGVLRLKKVIRGGLNLPIDIFFRSLAEDQGSNSVAVILSGTGSDGTLGIRAIKECGGMTLVQSERDAKFDGMPKSAITTGQIDLVRPASELGLEVSSFLRNPLFANCNTIEGMLLRNQRLYNRILTILRDVKNVDFTSYKEGTIIRRLEKRISINRFDNVSDYVDFLGRTPAEVEILFNEILIGVTRFFRDGSAFLSLENRILDSVFHNHFEKSEIRIWVPGCSTGEEAYSLAMLIYEYMQLKQVKQDVRIFATDIDEKSLKYAAIGFYPGNIAADVPQKYLTKYFLPHGNGYQICSDIRRMIIFARQNVVEDPPFFKMDMITCRNLLIYLNPDTQLKVLSAFFTGLIPNGILFLGSSESLGKLSSGFAVLDAKGKIFQKIDGSKPDGMYRAPITAPLHLSRLEVVPHEPGNRISQNNRQILSILEQVNNAFLPPSLVVDSDCNIIYTIGEIRDYLQMAIGHMTTNLLKMLPKELGVIVSSLVRRAKNSEDIISLESAFGKQPINIRCKRISLVEEGSTFYYICFEPVETKKTTLVPSPVATNTEISGCYQERIDDLEGEVLQQKENLQAAVEELETSNEELQASNEELTASNEELQSTNEELQSVNEELYTVNTEHVNRLAEIAELNADYDNLLSNTQIGTLFLDSHLAIRKVSRLAVEITNILQTDVGRPLYHLSLNSLYPEFMSDVESVNETKTRIEKELTHDGKYFFMRIVPYMVDKQTSAGIIISFVDLTESKLSALVHLRSRKKKAE